MKGLLECKDTLIKGNCKMIGDSSSTYIQKDKWIPRNLNKKPVALEFRIVNEESKVSDLISQNPKRWSIDRLNSLFDSDRVRNIIKMHLTNQMNGD